MENIYDLLNIDMGEVNKTFIKNIHPSIVDCNITRTFDIYKVDYIVKIHYRDVYTKKIETMTVNSYARESMEKIILNYLVNL